MAVVVGIDVFQRGGGSVERSKAEHTFPVGQVTARSGVLDDDRLAARQVARRPIADPGVLKLHARRLRTAELAARSLDVGAVRLGGAGDLPRVTHAPAMVLEAPP